MFFAAPGAVVHFVVYTVPSFMKTFLVYAFVAVTFLRPAGFVCVEASGAVHWEYTTCDSGSAASTAFSEADGHCGDCLDLTVAGASVPTLRHSLEMPAASVAVVTESNLDHSHVTALQSVFASAPQVSCARHLSSTVIRR